MIGLLIVLVPGGLRIQAQEALYVRGIPIYAVKSNGDLLWFSHIDYETGNFKWANDGKLKTVGSGWAQSLNIFKGDPNGDDGIIYRVDTKGDLYWYKHYGYGNGYVRWENGKKIGNNWQSRQVISGGGGVLYSLQNDGTLLWQRHLGYNNGSATWANKGVAKKVGVASDFLFNPESNKKNYIGWGNAKFIFSGGFGTVYMIDNKGDLYWNKHLGYQEGTDRWDARKKIGSGWRNLQQVFSGGSGIIYAVNNDGKLLWFNHEGFSNGANAWFKTTASEIGNGWVMDFVF